MGADYSWYRPSMAQLDQANVGFVARYLVPQSWGSGKALTVGEARQLLGSGRTILLNYEWSASSAKGGYYAGVRDAQNAEVARREVGAPDNLPIYLSIDYDERNPAVVVTYLNGAASVLGKARTGVYGGYYAVRAAEDAGFSWTWQTYAWSGGRWDSRADVHQYANGALWGGQGDKNRLVRDFGGWRLLPKDDGYGNLTPVPPQHRSPAPATPVKGSVYYVKAGDTLSSIAARYRTSAAEIGRVNGLRNLNLIYAGQRLVMPGSAPVSAPAPAAGTYVVRSGDTLSGVAARFGTTWQALQRLNGIANPNVLRVGQVLRVSGAPAPVVAVSYYTLKRGDTLSSLSARFGVSVSRLQALNGIRDANRVYAGQKIRVR